jgi:hypothetical protein
MTKTFKFKTVDAMHDFEDQYRIWEGPERWKSVSSNNKLLTLEITADVFSKKTLQAIKNHGGTEI